MDAPCKDCQYRSIECHSTCIEYLRYCNNLKYYNQKVKKLQLELIDYTARANSLVKSKGKH